MFVLSLSIYDFTLYVAIVKRVVLIAVNALHKFPLLLIILVITHVERQISSSKVKVCKQFMTQKTIFKEYWEETKLN